MNGTKNNGCNAAQNEVTKTAVINNLVKFLEQTPYGDLIETYAYGQRDAALLQLASSNVETQELNMLIYQYGELLKIVKQLDN